MRRLFVYVILAGLLPGLPHAEAAKKTSSRKTVAKPAAKKAPAKSAAKKKASPATSRATPAAKSRSYRPASVSKRASAPARGPWRTPTFADSTLGDHIDGEDLEVRRAAVEALGPYNGSIVVTDANTGRVLTLVNQKLALSGGFQPCSTIKLVAALAALKEGIIPRSGEFQLTGKSLSELTSAMAVSNNPYFASLGVKLGFERVSSYARLFGLGERASLDIPGETAGLLPARPPRNGGVGMMTSFGEGISLTPLQLAAFLGAVANGGTLYYLQHPQTYAEAQRFVPRVKRQLEIGQWAEVLKTGMKAAVDYGTARRAGALVEDPVFGKTGTCTDFAKAAHMGWFGSFNEAGGRKLVVVVMLTGGKPVNGPVASEIAGRIFSTLSRGDYFASSTNGGAPPVHGIGGCCAFSR